MIVRETVVRYVITHVHDKSGMRQLTFAQQGRWTYATMTEAILAMNTFSGPDGLPRVLSAKELTTLQVLPWTCWAGHFDPVGIYAPEEVWS